jgi:hypothetical protein
VYYPADGVLILCKSHKGVEESQCESDSLPIGAARLRRGVDVTGMGQLEVLAAELMPELR